MRNEIIKSTRKLIHAVSKESPVILTVLAVGGVCATIVTTAKATTVAERLIFESEEEKESPLEPKEVIKTAWKCYIPVALTAGITIVCIICAQSINSKRYAALAGLYSVSESAIKKYQDKVVETIGEKKEKVIRDDIAKEKIQENPMDGKTIYETGNGNYLFYDALSGRYFRSDIETMRRVQNDLNKDLIDDMWVSVNEMYSKIGLRPIQLGDNVGWNVDHLIDFQFSTQIAQNGEPCIVLDFYRLPQDLYKDSFRY